MTSRIDLLKRAASKIDDYVLYGRPIRKINNVSRYETPTLKEIQEYRREYPSEGILRAIAKLLARRHTEAIELNEDVVVSKYESPWGWEHDEIDLRGACFDLMEGSDVRWYAQRSGPTSEGWLLVENRRIVGAAEFRLRDGVQITADFQQQARRHWTWWWVYVDPEYRRTGVVSRRLSIWESRYGDFLIDQPNRCALALLEKTGALERHKLLGPRDLKTGLCMTMEYHQKVLHHE
jgi:ribosomal protein S18 acetylase RimI-like enzyme